MKIAVCGPATLSMLEPFVDQPIASRGYPFPGVSQLVLEYIRSGHEVVLITTAPDVDRRVDINGPRLHIRIIPSRTRARARAFDFFAKERQGILKTLVESDADVVHAHWTYEFGLAARRSGIPSLITVHDWAPAIVRHNRHAYWWFRAAMQVKCLMMPGALTAPTSYVASKVSTTYRRSCEVVPNGIELCSTGKMEVRKIGMSVGMLNVGFTDRKNVMTALRAWSLVRRAHPEAQLFLAGPDYEPYGPAHTWARSQQLTSGVVFQGALDPHGRTAWYADKDVFLHTSREESFGLVVIEAMAAGTPVVAGTTSGAIPEITKGAAVLVDIESPSIIAEVVLGLLDDEHERQVIVEKGLIVARDYDIRSVANRFLTILERLKA